MGVVVSGPLVAGGTTATWDVREMVCVSVYVCVVCAFSHISSIF